MELNLFHLSMAWLFPKEMDSFLLGKAMFLSAVCIMLEQVLLPSFCFLPSVPQFPYKAGTSEEHASICDACQSLRKCVCRNILEPGDSFSSPWSLPEI